MPPVQTLALIIGVIAVVLFIVGLISAPRGRKSVEQRLQTFAATTEQQEIDKNDDKRRSMPIADTLNRALEGRKVSEDLSTQLARADLKLTVVEFLVLQALTALGLAVAGYFLFGTVVLAILAAVIGWFTPRWFVSFRQGQRLRAFNDQLGDALN